MIKPKRSHFKLVRKAFVEWLAKQKPTRRFHCGDTERCVVAQYLTDTYNEGKWSVDGTYYEAPDPERRKDWSKLSPAEQEILSKVYSEGFRVPKWAQRLIEEFDELGKVVTTAQLRQAVQDKRVHI